jgi:hypothetical protein
MSDSLENNVCGFVEPHFDAALLGAGALPAAQLMLPSMLN